MNALAAIKVELATALRARGLTVHGVRSVSENTYCGGDITTTVLYWENEGGELRTYNLPGGVISHLRG